MTTDSVRHTIGSRLSVRMNLFESVEIYIPTSPLGCGGRESERRKAAIFPEQVHVSSRKPAGCLQVWWHG